MKCMYHFFCEFNRGDCWCSEGGEDEISEGSIVRLRLMGVTVDAGAIVSTKYIYVSNLN